MKCVVCWTAALFSEVERQLLLHNANSINTTECFKPFIAISYDGPPATAASCLKVTEDVYLSEPTLTHLSSCRLTFKNILRYRHSQRWLYADQSFVCRLISTYLIFVVPGYDRIFLYVFNCILFSIHKLIDPVLLS